MNGKLEGMLGFARWHNLWDPNAKIIWLHPGQWNEGKRDVVTLSECAARIRNNQPGTPVSQLRDGILCGDFDAQEGEDSASITERMKRAYAELQGEACHLIPAESGRPGHWHLFVISQGAPDEDIRRILAKHGADVRGRKAMRLPGTPNRDGMRGRVHGDLLDHQTAIKNHISEGQKPTFTNDAHRYQRKDEPGVLDRSAILQAHALECALAHMGLDLALATLAKEQPLGYDKIGKRAKPKGELYFVHCMLKAIGYNGRRSVETRINAWREEATATVQKDYSPRKRAAGLRVLQGIARLATQCGKLNPSMSMRELAIETGLSPMTVSKHLKELRGLNVIKRGFIEEGKEGYAYEYNLQSVGKMDTLGGAGGCCRGCTVSLHFGEDEKNGFGGSSQKWFVYEAILQLVAGNGSTTVREVVNVLGLDPKRGRDSVARHVRDLRKAGLITREGHVLKRGDTSPREYAAARGTSERMENRRKRYEADRDSYWKFWRKKRGLSEEETRAKFPPIRIAKPRTASTPARTLTPYTVEIETPQEPTERRILVTVGTRRNE